MQQKASAYVGGEQRGSGNVGQRQKNSAAFRADKQKNISSEGSCGSREKSDEEQQDKNDSTFILLILLILLSQGETDDKLLLALFYLLF